jgi:hypothetical protein
MALLLMASPTPALARWLRLPGTSKLVSWQATDHLPAWRLSKFNGFVIGVTFC